MRVIAGEARRLPLVAPDGKDTRPTTDRIKETLFNVIQDDVPGSRFLDLFSGSGGIAIEALSRGAAHATLVEMASEPLKCIEQNLTKTHMKDRATVFSVEMSHAVMKLGQKGVTFDIIYADPPYRKGYEEKILSVIENSHVTGPGTLVILESAKETPVDYVNEEVFEIDRVKEYKTNKHIFLRVR